jgi:hypothetical protein
LVPLQRTVGIANATPTVPVATKPVHVKVFALLELGGLLLLLGGLLLELGAIELLLGLLLELGGLLLLLGGLLLELGAIELLLGLLLELGAIELLLGGVLEDEETPTMFLNPVISCWSTRAGGFLRRS